MHHRIDIELPRDDDGAEALPASTRNAIGEIQAAHPDWGAERIKSRLLHFHNLDVPASAIRSLLPEGHRHRRAAG